MAAKARRQHRHRQGDRRDGSPEVRFLQGPAILSQVRSPVGAVGAHASSRSRQPKNDPSDVFNIVATRRAERSNLRTCEELGHKLADRTSLELMACAASRARHHFWRDIMAAASMCSTSTRCCRSFTGLALRRGLRAARARPVADLRHADGGELRARRVLHARRLCRRCCCCRSDRQFLAVPGAVPLGRRRARARWWSAS